MSTLHALRWLSAPAWLPLVHALLHTLWQGALAAGGLFLALRFVPARRANLRYGLSAAALLLVLLAGVGSWAMIDTAAPAKPSAASVMPAGGSHPDAVETVTFGSRPSPLPANPPPGLADGAAKVRPPAAAATAAGSSGAWVRWVALFWLLGVLVSLARAVKGTLGAGRLRRRCRALTDPRVLSITEELRGRLGLSRRVRFLVSEEIGVPSVMGILWPVVLLPAFLLTGVPVEPLRAVVAHELAHIRRWDYLANLAQMLVEALLFFNPFVWWISRQVRLEREACCDRIAAGECQSPARYVEALVAVIERGRPITRSPVLAASGPAGHGSDNALERARRLLVPGYQPALRLRWFSLTVILALSGLALSGLWLGTRAVAQTIQPAVVVVVDRTGPARPEAAPAPANDPAAGTLTYVPYHIRVVMEDGSPLGDGQVTVYNHDQFLNSGGGGSFTAPPDGSALVGVQANTLTFSVAASKEGSAAVFTGLFTPQNMGRLEGLELKLTPGYTAAIETVDEAGQPVANALLTSTYAGPPEVKYGELKADAVGVATFRHLAEVPLTVQVRADGYQADELRSVRLDAAKPYRWTLKKTSPLRGQVTAAVTGQPIANAVVRLAYVRGQTEQNYLWPGSGPVLAATNADGRFTLASLRPDSRYWFVVEAPGYGKAFVGVVTLAQGELNVALGPELLIHGKIIHAPPSMIHDGKLYLGYKQEFLMDQSHAGLANLGVEIPVVDGEAEFTAGPFYRAVGKDVAWNGTLEWARTNGSLSVDSGKQIPVRIDDLPQSGLVLDLAEKPPHPGGAGASTPNRGIGKRASWFTSPSSAARRSSSGFSSRDSIPRCSATTSRRCSITCATLAPRGSFWMRAWTPTTLIAMTRRPSPAHGIGKWRKSSLIGRRR